MIGLADKHRLRDGDIIFQTSRTGAKPGHPIRHWIQVQPLRSDLSNGYRQAEIGTCWEAVQPVKWTPLASWIARGEGGHFDQTTPSRASAIGTGLTARENRR